MRFGWVLLGGALVVVACGGDDEGTTRGGEGAVCADGHNCASGLVCFVQAADAIKGVCTKAPAACGSKLLCGCLEELEAPCTAGASCKGMMGSYLVACAQGPTLLKEGEGCSPVRDCEAGLFCHLPTPGKLGACKKLPDTCAVDPSCECFAAEGFQKACTGGWHCSISGDRMMVACN